MGVLGAVRGRLGRRADRFAGWPTLPGLPNSDRDDEHEFRLDVEHLAHLSSAVFGQAGRLVADDPGRAATVFADMLRGWTAMAEVDA